MKRNACFLAAVMLLLPLLGVDARAAETLIVVGKVVGLRLRDDTVTIAAIDESWGAAAKAAGLRQGDEIVTIDDITVDSAQDVRDALEKCDGSIRMTIRRSGRDKAVTMIPARTPEGLRLGVDLRQGISGVGTVTWYDPATGRFGTLGHGVSDARGTLLAMTEGDAFYAQVASVRKGTAGDPGQLHAQAEPERICGQLIKNTPQGVFGISREGWRGQAMETAAWEEIAPGPAVIRSTVEGGSAQDYSVEILKIYPRDRADCRNFLLKVTDSRLLNTTGGIVQGMSGSPIIQDGKLVGAVTHVLVNDPTRGYGIFIENMLDAAR